MKAKFYIYRNLNKGGFSVRYKGKVIGVYDDLEAVNVDFRVNAQGRQRVINQKRRNVHAYVVAESFFVTCETNPPLIQVSYNPYRNSTFVDSEGRKYHKAKRVRFTDNKCFIITEAENN